MMNYARAVHSHRGTQIFIFSLFEMDLSDLQPRCFEPGIYFVGKINAPATGVGARLIRRITGRKRTSQFIHNICQFSRSLKGTTAILYNPMLHLYWCDKLAACLLVRGDLRVVIEKNEMETGIVRYPVRFERWWDNLLSLLRFPLELPRAVFHDRLIARFDGVIAISTRIEAWSKRLNPQTLRVPILLDDMDYSPPAQAPSVFRIGYMGAISERKDGVLTLVRALGDLRGVTRAFRLDLYGSATRHERRALESCVAEARLTDRVSYHGLLPLGEVPAAMAACDLLTLTRPSTLQTDYGFSTKLASYLASGVPVIASTVSDNALFIQDGLNGFLVPPGDRSALRVKLRQILDHPACLADIGRRGRETALRHFHPDHYGMALGRFLFEGTLGPPPCQGETAGPRVLDPPDPMSVPVHTTGQARD